MAIIIVLTQSAPYYVTIKLAMYVIHLNCHSVPHCCWLPILHVIHLTNYVCLPLKCSDHLFSRKAYWYGMVWYK